MIETIITGICGAGWLATLLIFFVDRRDKKKKDDDEENKRLNDLEEAMKKNEKDSVRIQLLLLMSNYADEDKHELLTLAEHYFKVLKSNWYMTSKFKRFLKQHDIEMPTWWEESND